MEWINLLLAILNVFCAILMYKLENYKTAIFNGFVAGFCFYAFLIGLLLN